VGFKFRLCTYAKHWWFATAIHVRARAIRGPIKSRTDWAIPCVTTWSKFVLSSAVRYATVSLGGPCKVAGARAVSSAKLTVSNQKRRPRRLIVDRSDNIEEARRVAHVMQPVPRSRWIGKLGLERQTELVGQEANSAEASWAPTARYRREPANTRTRLRKRIMLAWALRHLPRCPELVVLTQNVRDHRKRGVTVSRDWVLSQVYTPSKWTGRTSIFHKFLTPADAD